MQVSGTLALAAGIAGMDRATLERLVAVRRPQTPDAVHDPIGLAVELLRPESITRFLRMQDRSFLAALSRLMTNSGATPQTAELLASAVAGLEHERPVALPEVSAELVALLERARVKPSALETEPPAPDSAGEVDRLSAGWYGQALTTTQRAAVILRALSEQPGRLNRRGTVPVTALRALAERTHTEPESIARLLETLAAHGLTAVSPADTSGYEQLRTTTVVDEWLDLPHTERWLALAYAHAQTASTPLRTSLRLAAGNLQHTIARVLPHEFPLLPERDREAAAAFAATAEELGLASAGQLTEPGLRLMDGDLEAARQSAELDMPAAVESVYVQPDLSVIVPGPLGPGDERSLLAFSDIEQLGIASSLRLSEASVARALEAGWTAAQVRSILERLSLTGIPQPLEYLLDDIAQRVGSIVVRAYDGDEGRSQIKVVRPELLDAMLVDRALQHLQLTPAPDGRLFSRLAAEHVIAALTSAKYPAIGAHGVLRPRSAEPIAPPVTEEDSLPPQLIRLVERVHDAARGDSGAGDVTRLLELAIRDRSPVQVTAEARGRDYTFTLLPVSLIAGRLRATDQAAGVERTLPVSAITGVAPRGA